MPIHTKRMSRIPVILKEIKTIKILITIITDKIRTLKGISSKRETTLKTTKTVTHKGTCSKIITATKIRVIEEEITTIEEIITAEEGRIREVTEWEWRHKNNYRK